MLDEKVGMLLDIADRKDSLSTLEQLLRNVVRLFRWSGFDFTVVDTGGIVYKDDPDDVFIAQIREQALLALGEATCVLFVVGS